MSSHPTIAGIRTECPGSTAGTAPFPPWKRPDPDRSEEGQHDSIASHRPVRLTNRTKRSPAAPSKCTTAGGGGVRPCPNAGPRRRSAFRLVLPQISGPRSRVSMPTRETRVSIVSERTPSRHGKVDLSWPASNRSKSLPFSITCTQRIRTGQRLNQPINSGRARAMPFEAALPTANSTSTSSLDLSSSPGNASSRRGAMQHDIATSARSGFAAPPVRVPSASSLLIVCLGLAPASPGAPKRGDKRTVRLLSPTRVGRSAYGASPQPPRFSRAASPDCGPLPTTLVSVIHASRSRAHVCTTAFLYSSLAGHRAPVRSVLTGSHRARSVPSRDCLAGSRLLRRSRFVAAFRRTHGRCDDEREFASRRLRRPPLGAEIARLATRNSLEHLVTLPPMHS